MDEQGLCAKCYTRLHRITAPFCYRCGVPLTPLIYDDDAICVECARVAPLWQQARAPLAYDDSVRDLILALKYGDRTELAPWFAQQMTSAAPELIASADTLIPIPLHWQRRLKRRYNQAALLAKAIQKQAQHLDYKPFLLRRVKATVSQGRFSRSQRRRNVKGVFDVANKTLLKERCVLLIDDVFTSGATVAEATRTLMKNGAKQVNVLTATRVLSRASQDNVDTFSGG